MRRRADVGRLVLTHLVAWNSPQTTLEQGADAWGDGLTIAVSGLVLEP